jgi:Flp pilus assembly protein TadD
MNIDDNSRNGSTVPYDDQPRDRVESQAGPADLLQTYIDEGRAQVEARRDDEAVERFAKALSIDPTDTVALANMGGALDRLGRHAEAVTAFRASVTAIDAGKIDVDSLLDLACALFDADMIEEAEKAYLSALSLRPDDAIALQGLACIYIGQSRHQDALDAINRIPADMPAISETHRIVGELYLSRLSPL